MKHFVGNGAGINKKGLCVKVRNDHINSAITALKNLLEEEGWIKEVKKHDFYISKAKRRRQKESAGRQRHLRDKAKRLFEEGY